MRAKILLILILIAFSSCKEPEARRPVSVKTHTSLKSTIDPMKGLTKKADESIQAYIQIDSTRTYINSNNGFWYTILESSDSKVFPKEGDLVSFEMEILDLQNQVLYSKEELGLQNYKVDRQELITGLQKGLKLMSPGEKFQFLIPFYSAYGILGDRNKIKSNQSIIAIITLKTIQ